MNIKNFIKSLFISLLFINIIGVSIVCAATYKSKVNVYLFRGEGCYYCDKALEWFEKIEKTDGDQFNLVVYEVWNDENNYALMRKVLEYFGESTSGYPYIIVGEKTWTGFDESYEKAIQNQIYEEYNKDPRDRFDVLNNIKGSNDEGIMTLILLGSLFGIITIILLSRLKTSGDDTSDKSDYNTDSNSDKSKINDCLVNDEKSENVRVVNNDKNNNENLEGKIINDDENDSYNSIKEVIQSEKRVTSKDIKKDKSINNNSLIKVFACLVLMIIASLIIVPLIVSKYNSNAHLSLQGTYEPNINTDDAYEALNSPALLVLLYQGIDFKENGTCSVFLDADVSCRYSRKSNSYTVSIAYITSSAKFDITFIKLDNNTLKDNFGYEWKKRESTYNSSDYTDDSTKSNPLKIGKKYIIVRLTNGKEATIIFNSDGSCYPDFSSFNNSGITNTSTEKINVEYHKDNPKCSYTISNNTIAISWAGIVTINYTYTIGTGSNMTSTIGEHYIMNDAIFDFNPDTNEFIPKNGNWEIEPGEFYLVYYKKTDQESNS